MYRPLQKQDRQADRTHWSVRVSTALLIPCFAFTAASPHQSEVQAQSRFKGRIQERIQKRLLQEESKLTDTQKQQLFEARRDWALSRYDQRLEQAREAMNSERQRLGVSPLRSVSLFGF